MSRLLTVAYTMPNFKCKLVFILLLYTSYYKVLVKCLFQVHKLYLEKKNKEESSNSMRRIWYISTLMVEYKLSHAQCWNYCLIMGTGRVSTKFDWQILGLHLLDKETWAEIANSIKIVSSFQSFLFVLISFM